MTPKIPAPPKRIIRKRRSSIPYIVAAIIVGIMAIVLLLIVLLMRGQPMQQQQICFCGDGASCAVPGTPNSSRPRNSWQGARPVPEPGTLPLMALGIGAVAWMSRTRSAK